MGAAHGKWVRRFSEEDIRLALGVNGTSRALQIVQHAKKHRHSLRLLNRRLRFG